MLTKKDGLTLLRELREKKNFTPVLILSGKTSVEDIVAGLDAGADDYMTKPFDFSELTARVKATPAKDGTGKRCKNLLRGSLSRSSYPSSMAERERD